MDVDLVHSNYYMGALFYTIIRLANNGIAELAMTVSRLPVFYRQRDFYFYPAWAYSIPAFVLRIPISLVESILWTALTYYVIGYSPEADRWVTYRLVHTCYLHFSFPTNTLSTMTTRFLRQFLLLFTLHLMATSLFRFLASVFQTPPAAACAGNLALVISCLFCGFIQPRSKISLILCKG